MGMDRGRPGGGRADRRRRRAATIRKAARALDIPPANLLRAGVRPSSLSGWKTGGLPLDRREEPGLRSLCPTGEWRQSTAAEGCAGSGQTCMVARWKPARVRPARRRHLRDTGVGRRAAADLGNRAIPGRSGLVTGGSLLRLHRSRVGPLFGFGGWWRGTTADTAAGRRYRSLPRLIAGWRRRGVRAAHQHFQLERIRHAAEARRNFGRSAETDYVR